MGRQLAGALFADLATARRREVMSAIAHYIAGVLERASMVDIIEGLCCRRLIKNQTAFAKIGALKYVQTPARLPTGDTADCQSALQDAALRL